MKLFKSRKLRNKVIPPKVKIAKKQKKIGKSLILLKNYTGALETGKVRSIQDGLAKIDGLLSLSLILEVIKMGIFLFFCKSSVEAYEEIMGISMDLSAIKSTLKVKAEAIKPDAEKGVLVDLLSDLEMGVILLSVQSVVNIGITMFKISNLK